jgi:tetratricopeptide (TPR) repeat protein
MIPRAAMICLLAAAVAPAGDRLAYAATNNADKEARALFQRAEMSFNLGKFSEALTDYQAAYQAKPLSGFLFNIAQCYRNMGNYERARFFYRRYLALEPRTSNRRLVEDLIGEMTRLMEKQQASATADHGAVPVTTTVPAGQTPPPLNEDKPVTLALAGPTAGAAASPTGGEAPSALVSAQPAEPPPRRPVYKRWWFWTGIGAVVAGGVVAAILLTRDGTPTGSLPPIDGR